MFLKHSVVVLALLYHGSQALKQCSDCILVDSCPEAVKLANNNKNDETADKFKKSLCGYNDKNDPKICCSDFAAPTEFRFGDLDTHPNTRLLPENCGDINGDRIVGGTVADLYEFPWMALISYRTRTGLKFLCGGTIINERYVLTAAHCIVNKNIAGVRLGEHDTRTKIDCQDDKCESFYQDLEVEEAISHADYKSLPRLNNDIGLLRLSEPADFSHKNIAPVCLPITPTLQNFAIRGANATVAGWGHTEEGIASPVLLKVRVPVHSSDNCRSLYNRGLAGATDDTLNKLCAGETKKDSCNGDSGGPLMIEESYKNAERIIQYGIVSYGPRKCGSDYPGVYTEVSRYMKWILDNMKP